MVRTRILIGATSAAIALSTALAPSALAGAHWSRKQCRTTYLLWYKHHIGSIIQPPTKKQAREADAYRKALEKTHHCVIGG